MIIFKYILFVISKQSQDLFIKFLVFSIFLIAKVVQQFLSILTKCCNYKVQSSNFQGQPFFLQYYKNYSPVIFYCYFFQDDRFLKVV